MAYFKEMKTNKKCQLYYITYINITITITYIRTAILFRMSAAAQDLYNKVSTVLSRLLSLSPLYFR